MSAAEVTDLFFNLPGKFEQYSLQAPNAQKYTGENAKLLDTQIELNKQLEDIHRKEQTYDREFLDRRATPPKPGMFDMLGLQTSQDWSIFLLYFSYFFFSIILFLNAILYSSKKLIAGLAAVSFSFVMGMIGTLMIHRYA